MKPLTSEWVEKAEKDFASALREMRVRYPGRTGSCADAREALNYAKQVRTIARESLNLPLPMRRPLKRTQPRRKKK